MAKNNIGDVFLYLIQTLENNENWHVRCRAKDKGMLAKEFYGAIKKHTNILKGILNAAGEPELDSHKQATVICLSVLDVCPLKEMSKLVRKKMEFYFANEFIAMHMGRFHVTNAASGVQLSNPRSFDNVNKLLHDKHPYDHNFMCMLRLERNQEQHNYLMLSKLFYHFESDYNKENRRLKKMDTGW
ncbi:MAG: hypothetical protein FWH17_03570 [Oscillospiraceae bacterium]|nr:hypothetical protein [Oscillospiraceae bacterium]